MKTISKHFRIVAYGDAFSRLRRTGLPQTVRGVSVLKRWAPVTNRTRDIGEFLLVSSDELDDTFVETFREYATQATRLLVLRQAGVSTDRLLSRILDLQIRTPQRCYVFEGTFGMGKTHLAASLIHSLIERLVSGLEAEDSRLRILDARVENGILHVVSPSFDRLEIPASEIPVLKVAEGAQLQNLEIDEDGAFIFWPDLDVHLGWTQLQEVINPLRQKSEDFNKRYGKAVQKVREAAGVKPTEVQGLSEKQLTRIERGECRLTSNAIEALSKAHGAEPNEYMGKLAESLE